MSSDARIAGMSDSMAHRVLVATVGTGRERRDIARAIAYSVVKSRATHVLLLCSQKTAAETLPCVQEVLPASVVQKEWVCPAGDEDDVQKLVVAWGERIAPIIQPWLPAEVLADFTSGTKAMSAALVVWAVQFGHAVQLSYVTGPRDQTGRATQSTDVIRFCPTLVHARRTLDRAVEFFAAADFAAARVLTEPLLTIDQLPHDGMRKQARRLHYLAAAWEAWDRFDWRKAFSHFHQLGRELEDWGTAEESATLLRQKELLTQLKGCSSPGAYPDVLIADLMANTQRCVRRGQYDNATARLYRATEMLGQKILRETYKLDSGNVEVTKLPALMQQEYGRRQGDAKDGKLKLGLQETWSLIHRLGHRAGAQFVKVYDIEKNRGELCELLKKRNQSLLAHGSIPIGKDVCDKLFGHLRALADLVCAPGCLDELINSLRPLCPPLAENAGHGSEIVEENRVVPREAREKRT